MLLVCRCYCCLSLPCYAANYVAKPKKTGIIIVKRGARGGEERRMDWTQYRGGGASRLPKDLTELAFESCPTLSQTKTFGG